MVLPPREFLHVVMVVLISVQQRALADKEYCKLKCDDGDVKESAMCKFKPNIYAKECGKPDAPSFLNKTDRQIVLDQHNFWRNSEAGGGGAGVEGTGGAKNMNELVWDEELTLIARRWVLQCVFDHDKCRMTSEGDKIGQNLGRHTYPTSQDDFFVDHTFHFHLERWYNQSFYFDKKTLASFTSERGLENQLVGYYTQLVWAATTRVGCERLLFPYKKGERELFCCNYSPAGNVAGKPVYQVAAGKAEVGKDCKEKLGGDKYPNLCKAATESVGLDAVYEIPTDKPPATKRNSSTRPTVPGWRSEAKALLVVVVTVALRQSLLGLH